MVLTTYLSSLIPAGMKHSQQEILDALYFTGGLRQASFKANLLSRDLSPLGTLELEGGGIDFGAFSQIKRSGKFKTRYVKDIDYLTERLQPLFVLHLPGEDIEFPLGIFLLATSPPADSGYGIDLELQGYDSTIILLRDTLDAVLTIPVGTNIINEAVKILADTGFSRVRFTNSEAVTGRDMMWELGTSKLQVINDLLAAVNYTEIWFDRNGFAVIQPYLLPTDREIDITYQADELTSVIMPGLTNELDLFNIPNKIVVTVTNSQKAAPLVSVYENHNVRSPLSIDRVGWVNARTVQVSDITDQATLDGYTRRLAYNNADQYNTASWSTPNMPLHDYYNCLFLGYPRIDINARFLEASWSMDFTGTMRHTARRQVEV